MMNTETYVYPVPPHCPYAATVPAAAEVVVVPAFVVVVVGDFAVVVTGGELPPPVPDG